jgi:MFS family permease
MKSVLWNSLHVIILPAVLLHLVPEAFKNTYLGVLTFFGLVIAMIVQPISGSLSDRWRSRWGRRRPLILIGTAFDFIFLALLGWAGGFWWLAIGYLGLQLTSNMAHGPVQGLLPDRIPPEQMGVASGIKNVMDRGRFWYSEAWWASAPGCFPPPTGRWRTNLLPRHRLASTWDLPTWPPAAQPPWAD